MRKLAAILCLTLAVLLFSAGEGFALPPCPEDQSQRWHECLGTHTFTGKHSLPELLSRLQFTVLEDAFLNSSIGRGVGALSVG